MRPTTITIRRMCAAHIELMLRVEQSSRENFWNKDTFQKHLRAAGHDGFVALVGDELVGFLAYEEIGKYIQIWNFVVARKKRGRGVADALLTRVKGMVPAEFDGIQFNVRESNVAAQCFLRKHEFFCDTISEDYFIDDLPDMVMQEDAYCFDYNPKKVRPALAVPRHTDRLGAVVVGPRHGGKPVPFGVPDLAIGRSLGF